MFPLMEYPNFSYVALHHCEIWPPHTLPCIFAP